VADSIKIMLVEDNPGDVRLTKEALSEGKINNELVVAKNGEEALDCLYQRGKFNNCGRPDVILLDLNLPKIDGREVLNIIKSEEEFKQIPVIVLTTSKSEEDIWKAYNLHANCYITKPIDMEEFLKIIRLTEQFWLTIVQLPPRKTANVL
jgi:two-component system, chemotaxis family, response regulator Rcp1